VLEVFRFAWFAVRTFFGVIALVLALEAALWAFVKIHSTLMSNVDSDAALKRVTLYNAPGVRCQGKELRMMRRQWCAKMSAAPFSANTSPITSLEPSSR
jgi:hypothetical protein